MNRGGGRIAIAGFSSIPFFSLFYSLARYPSGGLKKISQKNAARIKPNTIKICEYGEIGRHKGLYYKNRCKKNRLALFKSNFVGIRRLNASKFGETLPMATPSQAFGNKGRCRDLTLAT